MPLETGTFISDLVATNPVDATDPVSQGDDHLRLIKSTVLNTFPNITGAVTLTHLQLNDAAQRSVLNNFTARQEITLDGPALDLVDSAQPTDGKRWGVQVSGTSWQVVTYDDARSASEVAFSAERNSTSELMLRAIMHAPALPSGNVKRFASEGSGYVTLFSDDNVENSARGLFFSTQDGFTTTAIIDQVSGVLTLRNRVNSGRIELNAENSGGSLRRLFRGDPDGEVELFHGSDGLTRFVTVADGVSVQSTTDQDGTSNFISFRNTVGTLRSRIGNLGPAELGDFEIDNRVGDRAVVIKGRNTTDDLRTMAIFEPTGSATISFNGEEAIRTRGAGLGVSHASSDTPTIFLSDDAQNDQTEVVSGPTSLRLRHLVNSASAISIEGTDGGGVVRDILRGVTGSTCALYGNNLEMLRVQALTTSGGVVREADNTLVDIGFNVAPIKNINASDTLEAGHCGKFVTKINSTGITLTLLPNTDLSFPVGGMVHGFNAGPSGDYTITEGAGTTLYVIQDGVGRTDANGSATVGAGGVFNIYRAAATEYYMWGSAITA